MNDLLTTWRKGDKAVSSTYCILAQNPPHFLEASEPLDRDMTRPSLKGWWRCCECHIDINPAVHDFTCPVCSHERCNYCMEISNAPPPRPTESGLPSPTILPVLSELLTSTSDSPCDAERDCDCQCGSCTCDPPPPPPPKPSQKL